MFTWEEVAEWFNGLTCFVSTSKAEGFGLMQLQAMAVGRPVIACEFSGITEFFNSSVGYPVDYNLIESTGVYRNCGHYASPSAKHVSELMARVYDDRKEAAQKGIIGAKVASRFSCRILGYGPS